MIRKSKKREPVPETSLARLKQSILPSFWVAGRQLLVDSTEETPDGQYLRVAFRLDSERELFWFTFREALSSEANMAELELFLEEEGLLHSGLLSGMVRLRDNFAKTSSPRPASR